MKLKFKKYLQGESGYKGGKAKPDLEGKKIYKLSSNENALGSSPKAMEAIDKFKHTLYEYPDAQDERLRTALSEYYKGELLDAQFITTNSGVANLEMIIQGFMDEESECIYSDPAFGPYKEFPKKFGARAKNVPLVGDEFDMNVSAILEAVTDKTSIIFITSPNNPTGTYLPKNHIDELISKVPDHVVVVFDEVYFQYADAEDYVRALPYVLAGKNVIGVNSFSKAYGLAGLRIGYSYSTPEIAQYLRNIRRPFMINKLSLEAAMAALQDEEFIEKTVNLAVKEKYYMYEQLDALGVKYWKTQANFIMMEPEMSPSDFEDAMLLEGIMVRPVGPFGAPTCVRVTLGTREANDAFLKAYRSVMVVNS